MEITGTTFGELLKSLRKRRRMTQQKLADRLGVHRSTLFRWEQGDYLPESKAMILELAKHLCLDDLGTRHLLEVSLTALAPHWLVPYPRNPFFTGREEILEKLHIQLGVDQAVVLTQSSALHGLGGVGKTQVALEYAYRRAMEYSAVFWIGAETDEQIVSNLLHIAEVLALPERKMKDQQLVIGAVQSWLSTHGEWLLIWDNVEDLTVLDRFLPPVRPGSLLITTRCQALGTLARGLDLLPMGREEGILFLLHRAKALKPEDTSGEWHHIIESKPGEYAAAEELVLAMGGLPLALDQAGAYIEETGCGLAGYLRLYEQQLPHLLDRRGGLGKVHPHSVTMTFRLAIERVEQECPAAADVLRICALLHADAIPEELFMEGADYLGPDLQILAANPTQFDIIVAVLRKYTLLHRQVETSTISLHRLVQAVIKDSLDTTVAQLWSKRAMQAINAVFAVPDPDGGNWECCERFVAHAQMSLQLRDQSGRSIPEAGELFAKVGGYLLEMGRYAEAEKFLLQACSLVEQGHEENSRKVTYALDRLATLYWRQEKYQQAESLFQKALAISEQFLGFDHICTADYLNNLSLLYLGQGNYEQAEKLCHRSLSITELQLEPLHSDLAVSLDNMARIFVAQGKYGQAEQFFQRALAIWEAQPENAKIRMAFCLNNMGTLYIDQEKYEKAEPFLQQALALRQQILGPEHPRTAHSMYNLARLFLKKGEYEEAEQLSERALLILEQHGELEDSLLAATLENLGVIHQSQEKYEQAEPLFRRALAILERKRELNHPIITRTLHDFAIYYQMRGNFREAISLAERALSIRIQILGIDHPYTLATRTLYDQLYREQVNAQEEVVTQRNAEEKFYPDGVEHHKDENIVHRRADGELALSQNDLVQAFLDACCELHPRAWCRISDLWQAYERWGEMHQERFPLSRRVFATQLQARGCRTDRTNTARIWCGITLVKQDLVTKRDKL